LREPWSLGEGFLLRELQGAANADTLCENLGALGKGPLCGILSASGRNLLAGASRKDSLCGSFEDGLVVKRLQLRIPCVRVPKKGLMGVIMTKGSLCMRLKKTAPILAWSNEVQGVCVARLLNGATGGFLHKVGKCVNVPLLGYRWYTLPVEAMLARGGYSLPVEALHLRRGYTLPMESMPTWGGYTHLVEAVL
jgi:hypothetical protein